MTIPFSSKVWYSPIIKFDLAKTNFHNVFLACIYRTCFYMCVHSSVASPICQEGQSGRNFPIFPLFSRFFVIFSPNFLDFWQIFAVRGGTLPPLPPQWLRHCAYKLQSVIVTSLVGGKGGWRGRPWLKMILYGTKCHLHLGGSRFKGEAKILTRYSSPAPPPLTPLQLSHSLKHETLGKKQENWNNFATEK